jgi:Ca2+-binding RTX toxin-like protein
VLKNTRNTVLLSAMVGLLAVSGTAIADGGFDTKFKGTDGNDTFAGTAGRDFAKGKKGDDTLSGAAERDFLLGGKGDDTLNGDEGNDYLNGGKGSDTLNGGEGDDFLKGGKKPDTLNGGPGADRIWAKRGGIDTIDCGANDGAADKVKADRDDVITNCGDEDTVRLRGRHHGNSKRHDGERRRDKGSRGGHDDGHEKGGRRHREKHHED